MRDTFTWNVKNENETKAFAKEFARSLKIGDVLCLYGELGAGKTTFTRFLVEALGFGDRVMSPTFTIVRSYSKNNTGSFKINHIDLYRLESSKSIKEIGIDELYETGAVTIIEWPEKLQGDLPTKRYDIFFSITGENSRTIEYKKYE